jgi:hypothetical protein
VLQAWGVVSLAGGALHCFICLDTVAANSRFIPKKHGANEMVKKLSRAEIKAGLDSFPIESLLSSGTNKKPQLTSKAKAFARAVALGETKASAYRNSYKQDATPSTMATAPYVLAADSRIQQEIEAYKLALEAEKHRTPAQLKALLVQQLVQHSIDPDFPPAQRVQCLKLIGSLFDVGAFLERKEITTVQSSNDLRARLLTVLGDVQDVTAKDDAADLLQEIQGAGMQKVDAAQPTTTPPPQDGACWPDDTTHTISLIGSSTKKDGGTPSHSSQDDEVMDFDK